MDDRSPVMLRAGSMEMTLRPEVGGSIGSLTFNGGGTVWPVFRGATSEQNFVLEMASFPLVPWVNRVRDGGFTFRGRDVHLSPERRIDPSPLHGHGWLAPWSVEHVAGSEAVLGFHHPGGEWPWRYSASQRILLDETGVTLELSCTNESREPMPCGLGHHPYFHCGPDTRIDTQVTHTWTIDELVLPVEKVPAEGPFSMKDRAVCAQQLDHGFAGWSGTTTITDPNWPFAIRFSSPTARFFQLYSPPEGGFFVAEPVTHANTALNAPEEQWKELGMEVLGPGETMRMDARFEVLLR